MSNWTHLTREQQIAQLEKDWAENPRWKGIKRGYSAADVVKLRGSLQIEHTLAKRGAEKLWNLINTEPFVNTLGALTGNQAMQQVKAGLKAHLPVRLAGGRRRQQQRRDVPRPVAVLGGLGAEGREEDQRHLRRAPTRSSGAKARAPATRATSTTSRPSWPMPKPASAAC